MNLTALNSPNYRRYFIGSAAAVNGLWILRVVITWIAWETSLSATFVGLIAALTMLPTMIIGPFFGAIMDRSNIIKAAYATNIGMIIAALITVISILIEIISPFSLILLAIYIGIITAAHHPMRLSIGPRLVQKEQISSVSALAALNFNTARVISPFFGGLLIEYFGTLTALLIAILLYLPNIIIYTTLHPRRLKVSGEHQSISAAIKEGFLFVWASKYLRLIFLISAVYTISIRSVAEILPVIADGIFAKGAAGLGILTSIAGFGAVVAGITKVFTQSQKAGEIPKFVIASALLGVALIPLVGLSNTWELTVGYICYLGFAGTLSGISIQTALQMDLPDNFRGRVMSLWTVVNVGATATGAMILGGLADYIGIPTAFCFAGGLCTVLLITAVLKNR